MNALHAPHGSFEGHLLYHRSLMGTTTSTVVMVVTVTRDQNKHSALGVALCYAMYKLYTYSVTLYEL